MGKARPANSATRAIATDKNSPGQREFLRGRAALLPLAGCTLLAAGVTVADKAWEDVAVSVIIYQISISLLLIGIDHSPGYGISKVTIVYK